MQSTELDEGDDTLLKQATKPSYLNDDDDSNFQVLCKFPGSRRYKVGQMLKKEVSNNRK